MTITQTTLPNKLRVLSTEMPDAQSVTICIFVGTGSRYETKDINGVSHFLEHLYFSGTKKRPSSLDISRSIEEVGGDLNAYTSEDKTNYHVRLAPEHFERGMDTLSDMLTGSVFSPEKIEKERGVVIEEINLYQDDPGSLVGEIAPALVWPNSALGFTILGPKEVISRLKREEIIEYIGKRYSPDNMVVSVAGPFSHKEVESMAQKYLGDISGTAVGEAEPAKELQSEPSLIVRHKETDQTHMIVGIRGLALEDPRLPALRLMTGILGSGMSSRLFQNVREQKGLAYSVFASVDTFIDTGLLACKAGVNNEKVSLALSAILEELARFRNGDVSEEDVSRAKDQITGGTRLGLDGTRPMANWTGARSIMTGKPRTIEEALAEIEKVTLEDVRKVASELISDDRLNLAVVGPHKDEAAFKSILTVEA